MGWQVLLKRLLYSSMDVNKNKTNCKAFWIFNCHLINLYYLLWLFWLDKFFSCQYFVSVASIYLLLFFFFYEIKSAASHWVSTDDWKIYIFNLNRVIRGGFEHIKSYSINFIRISFIPYKYLIRLYKYLK